MTNNAILDTRTETLMATRNQHSANDAAAVRTQAAGANRADQDGREQSGRDEQWWQAVLNRDASHDGQFFFGVSSTGVFCRPSCPAKRPRRENVSFFRRPEDAERAGFRACLRCKPKSAVINPQVDQVKAICRYIEQHLDEPITLARLSDEFGQSPFHLQRTFKRTLGVSPKAYADSCRMGLLKQNLRAGHNVTRALYDAGYGSSSRLYERTASQLGMTPDKYRRGAIASTIRYTFVASPLGRMLVAATDKGICSIKFGESDEELGEGLKREFPFATRKRDEAAMKSCARSDRRYRFQGWSGPNTGKTICEGCSASW